MDYQKQVLKKMTTCKLVKGYAQSLIYDLQNNEYFCIPNELYDILCTSEGKSLCDIEKSYGAEDMDVINNCIDFLLGKDIVFFCDKENENNFSDLDLNWQTPTILENFILDVDNESQHDYNLIIENLSDFLLKVLQIRFFTLLDIFELEKIIDLVEKSNIQMVELIVKDNPKATQKDWEKLIDTCVKIMYITVYDSTKNEIIQYKQGTLLYTTEKVVSHNDCGIISRNIFACNMNLFCESQKYNSCLNKKASIDVNGTIRNCPSMPKSFGHYKNTSLDDIVRTPEFQEYWKLNKDHIKVCQDCEYRYMCTDCRAYLKNPNDIHSQPAKCTYNPYIAKWEGEEGYISVEEYLNVNQ